MDNQNPPVYRSKPTIKSLGNEYCIYYDRIELRCRFPFITKTLVIKKADLISIDVFKPPVLRTTFWALKMDLADLKQHVGIKRRNGFFRQLRFTPEVPEAFVSKVREIFEL